MVGEIMPELMSQLVNPEEGWKRVSCADSNVIYSGDWRIENYASGLSIGHWNNYSKYTHSTDAYLEFYFTGSKFRLITGSSSNKKENNNIDIDDEKFTFNNYLASGQARTLSFEKLDLKQGIHKVKIYSKVINGSYNMQIEAFDIGKDDILLSEEQCNYIKSLSKTQLGDITFNRVLKNNLPSSVSEKIGLYFTEDKGLYINNNDGVLVNINHNHTNENVLNLLSANDNNLLFNGNIIDVDDPALTDEDKSNIIENIFSASGSGSIIHGTYGMQYISESKKDSYELALKICEDNSDFYYSSAYWTNDTLLNENDYTDMTKNSKYECFINKPVKDILFVLNNIKVHVHLDKQYNSLKELFTNGGTASCEEYILNDTKSLFGYDRAYNANNGEIYNTGFLINYIWNTEESTISGGVRIGFTVNDTKNNKDDFSGSFEGLGIFSNSNSSSDGRNEKQSCNSGRTAWQLPKQFSKAFIYIK